MDKKASAVLKGIAMIMVVLFHLHYDFAWGMQVGYDIGLGGWYNQVSENLSRQGASWFWFLCSLGYIGVNLFFVISGYGLTKKFLKQPKFEYKDWLKQIWKILWPYWVALPVTHLINYGLANVQLALGKIDSMPGFWGIYYPQQYIDSFLVPTRWLSDDGALNFVGTWWFVGVILQFYLLLPLLILLLKKINPNKFMGIMFAVTLLYRLWATVYTDGGPIGVAMAKPLMFINFPARLAEFALGMWLATRKDLKFFRFQTLAGFVLIILGLIANAYHWGFVVSDPILGIGFVLMLNWNVNFIKGLVARIFEAIGNNSYYIFLYHEPALTMLVTIFLK